MSKTRYSRLQRVTNRLNLPAILQLQIIGNCLKLKTSPSNWRYSCSTIVLLTPIAKSSIFLKVNARIGMHILVIL